MRNFPWRWILGIAALCWLAYWATGFVLEEKAKQAQRKEKIEALTKELEKVSNRAFEAARHAQEVDADLGDLQDGIEKLQKIHKEMEKQLSDIKIALKEAEKKEQERQKKEKEEQEKSRGKTNGGFRFPAIPIW